MKIGNWYLGWSRNVAIGVMWTPAGKVAILFLGITLAKGLDILGRKPYGNG